MPFNVLLLPLLGGYVFISRWNRTRFDAARYSGERLLFHSAIAGVLFLLVAFIATRIAIARAPEIYSDWREIVPFEYTGTSFLAFLLGVTAWWPLNAFFRKERESRRAIERWGDFLELLFNRSIEETEQLSISLTSGKAYIGFVTSSFDPAFEPKHIMLLPTLSGYRDRQTSDLVITQDYAEVYSRLSETDPAKLLRLANEFQLVVPISEITTASLFDAEVYTLFTEA